MQNITQTTRSSRIRFVAVLALLATLTTLTTAATRGIANALDLSARHASAVHNPAAHGRWVTCPGSANVCPGGTQAPASVFNVR